MSLCDLLFVVYSCFHNSFGLEHCLCLCIIHTSITIKCVRLSIDVGVFIGSQRCVARAHSLARVSFGQRQWSNLSGSGSCTNWIL